MSNQKVKNEVMKDRERQLIYDALCETLFYAEDNGGYYQCNYSVEEIRNLADKYKPQHEHNEVDCRRPENYFFCKLGGLIPKCSDCLRNYANSPYTATDIDTWMQPGTLGTKQCSDYIRKEQPEETIDKSLDEAAEEYVQKGHLLPEAFIVIPTFKEGARWQREQMLKGVVEGEVKYHDYPEYKYVLVPYEEFNDGDKVRIIIVKEEEDK